MIRKAHEREQAERPMFGGPGLTRFTTILSKDEMAGKGRVFSQVTLAPGCAVGYHVHEGDFEVYFVLNGRGVYDDNGTKSEVGPGDVLICGDGEGHGLLNTGSENLDVVAVVLYS